MAVMLRERGGIQYARRLDFMTSRLLWNTGSSALAGDDDGICSRDRSGYAAGTGSAVTDLIFSIAKREVTFFSGTAPISFL
jgi:hypothetical protein